MFITTKAKTLEVCLLNTQKEFLKTQIITETQRLMIKNEC